MAYGRVPEYHRANLGSFGRVQRLSNMFAGATKVNTATVTASALDVAAKIATDEVKESENLIQKAFFEQSRLNVESGMASLASKYKFDVEGFEKAVNEDRTKLLGEIPSKNTTAYASMFDSYKNHYRQAIVRNQQKQQEETIKASFLTANKKYFDDAVRFARTGNEDLIQENVKNYMENRELLFKQGFVSPEAYVKMGEDLADNVELQKNLGIFDTVMPQGDEAVFNYLNNFEQRNDMSIDRRDRFASAMAAEYNSYKARHAVQQAEYRKQAGFVIDALNNGLEPQIDIAGLENSLKMSGDIDSLKKLQTAVSLSQDVKSFVKLSPGQMTSLLEENRNNIKTEYDLARFNALQKTYASAVKELSEDPLNFALSRNVVQDKGFDAANPEAVTVRLENGRFLKEKYNLPYVPVMTKAEGEAAGKMIAMGDYQSNAAFLGQIYQSFGEDAEQVFELVGKKNPEFAQAASVFLANPDTALGILHGASIVKNQKEFVPKADDFNKAYYDLIGLDVFDALKSEDQAHIKDSVYVYAAKLNYDKGNTDKTVDDEVLEKAVKDVLGDVAEIDRDGWFAGSIKVIAPQGVTADNFETWFSQLEDEKLKGAYTALGYSVSAQKLRESGRLFWVGDRKYQIKIDDWLLLNEDGTPFVLTYDGE